ncbi:PREDICTED: uncharacterized protein LOC109239991 [Nicotiana attenuata]|uniref:Transmembrane protein n=1 Tax=Nicotiana attenuata TaxID=49451 RepID=A0A314L8W1_NICAT|nr:PREDICTED: uncharacterized protein LOC109239991 [Nicotiana attenuata]OIT38015.1 hypothetical protein A4A49_30821 [Nicotiana attenuata]
MAVSISPSYSNSSSILPTPSITKSPFRIYPLHSLKFPFSSLKSQSSKTYPKRTTILVCAAENGNNDTVSSDKEVKENGSNKNNNGGRPRLNLRWVDLILDPDPDNIVAVGLTGLLTWASVSILWQLFVIALAILLAALKYSFIAALLIFILITLL